ncbi:MAG: CBS domain-containing protein [Candidatus Bathyarchaeota archaeon]|nr:MAG: CBS domain-containing protein [Candidatus Bathyarchaeota archaeon]
MAVKVGILVPLRVEDVMVHDVITIAAGAKAAQAVELMTKHEIGCLIVVDEGQPVGIVTERDMLNRVLRARAHPVDLDVGEIMSSPLVVGRPKMGIEEAVELMFKHKIKKLPVVDSGRLRGLVTMTDLACSLNTIKMMNKLAGRKTPKRMLKVIDYYNRILGYE